jgi:hypothetical protein
MWIILLVILAFILGFTLRLLVGDEFFFNFAMLRGSRKRRGGTASAPASESSQQVQNVQNVQGVQGVTVMSDNDKPPTVIVASSVVEGIDGLEQTHTQSITVVSQSLASASSATSATTEAARRAEGIVELKKLMTTIKSPCECEDIHAFCKAYKEIRQKYGVTKRDLEKTFSERVPSIVERLKFFYRFKKCVADPKEYFED